MSALHEEYDAVAEAERDLAVPAHRGHNYSHAVDKSWANGSGYPQPPTHCACTGCIHGLPHVRGVIQGGDR